MLALVVTPSPCLRKVWGSGQGEGAVLHRFSVMKATREQEERAPRVSYGIRGYRLRMAHCHWGLNPNPLPTEPSTTCLEKLHLKFRRLVFSPNGRRWGVFGVLVGLVCRTVDIHHPWGSGRGRWKSLGKEVRGMVACARKAV